MLILTIERTKTEAHIQDETLSNFYPLSDGPSTRHRRITKADFRPCSTGGFCSQAPFCLCTRGPISVRPEETFARLFYLCEEAPLLPKLRGYFAEFLRESCLAPLGILYLPTCVGFGYRYPFVEGRSSFSWEYSMGYFSAVTPGTRTLARGIFSTPSYPEKAGAPCVLELITIFRLT
ncbi:hypothetical protein LWI28_027186 [Acer negundo]|uniref:Uncharacterized protein n=1 Tax=Acer negundo TaxID=4023 RepID=A0AAD5JBR0_ACENE|nr:hypothetical protein LWI28_027186 [Acer negundo]